ncbi:Protein of unknown function [Pyronema omphalodes CBS 100304]|uniref:Uncharacterized protein n=1 Tax=Pyronema omphalodes (strain CBS 100304) TaxID=1076935 RepID=U4LLG0_PYROM|nr:Protein of unknown function [Pyronema omphalodes CBS 100304]
MTATESTPQNRRPGFVPQGILLQVPPMALQAASNWRPEKFSQMIELHKRGGLDQRGSMLLGIAMELHRQKKIYIEQRQ